jgi:uncharacterized protein (DUF486 family)
MSHGHGEMSFDTRHSVHYVSTMLSLLLVIAVSLGVVFLRWRWRRRPHCAIVANVFLCALVLNYIWEIAQLPLFTGFTTFHLLTALRHCAWYTLGDATIVICLYALGAWRHRTWGWGLQLHRFDWLWLPCAGMLVAMIMERLALDFGRWQYGPHMPVLPGVEVGLLPVVQMGFLPLLSVLLAKRLVPHVAREARHT